MSAAKVRTVKSAMAKVSTPKPSTLPNSLDTSFEDMTAGKFPGRKIDLTKIDSTWEQQRGATTRRWAMATSNDVALGVAWWNAMTDSARLAALKAVKSEGRASPAEAWEHWKEAEAGFKCEESAHG